MTMSVTIINGGTQGLGEQVARTLATRGATGLVLAGRSVERGSALADELSSAGTPSIYVEADMASGDAPTKIVDACDATFGVVNGLVNVAALTSRSTIWSDTPEHFDAMMRINVQAPYFLIQAATRLMVRERAPGSVVNVGSTSGHGGQPRLAAYSISKGALSVMTRNLAYALMRDNVRVNQVNPGWMDTESEHWTQLREENAAEDWLIEAEASRPFGRLVKPWEVANAIVFLLSDDSGLMTGNSIDIDQSVSGAGDPPIPGASEQLSAPSDGI
jgi:NAD(P)-dependent dehydrogenase (short-subunit alcohol dehydrogenase family)